MSHHPGPTLSYAEELQQYQVFLAEILPRIDFRLREFLRAELVRIEEEIRKLLSNPVSGGN